MERVFTLIRTKAAAYLPGELADLFTLFLILLFFSLSGLIAFYLIKNYLLRIIGFFIEKSKNSLDDVLWQEKFYHYIPHLSLALALTLFVKNPFLNEKFPAIFLWLDKLTVIYLSLTALFMARGFLKILIIFYETLKLPDNFNLKGIYQAVIIFLYVLTAIIIVSTIIEESPWKMLSGLGALTAVLLLIFREPILGFVSGVQIFANKMAKVGDWIEMPQHNVDGSIIDITLTTIKIKNWDNTIVQLPSHALTSDSFKNWEGMTKSGGRRIKRSLVIDMKTVRFITEKEMKDLKKKPIFKNYFAKKESEVNHFEMLIDARGLKRKNKKEIFPTTLGVFREYTLHYLRNHSQIHQKFTLMVRGLAPIAKGVPIEVYCFTKTTDWIPHERIQSEIFEHLMAVAKGFHLKIFQDPTGDDFKSFKSLKN